MFLDSIRERQQEEERLRKERDGEEVKNFKECVCLLLQLMTAYSNLNRRAVAARTSAAANSATASITASTSNAVAKPKPSVAPKKDIKKTLKGVVVKKKAKVVESEKPSAKGKDKDDDPLEHGEGPRNAKRRKIAT